MSGHRNLKVRPVSDLITDVNKTVPPFVYRKETSDTLRSELILVILTHRSLNIPSFDIKPSSI